MEFNSPKKRITYLVDFTLKEIFPLNAKHINIEDLLCIEYGTNFNIEKSVTIPFDTDEYHSICIRYVPNEYGKMVYVVYAIPKNLSSGPEYHINTDIDEDTKKIKNIIIDYLQRNNTCIKIEQFV